MDDAQAARNVALAKGISGPNHHNTEAVAPFRKAFDHYRASADAARATGLVAVYCDYVNEGGATAMC